MERWVAVAALVCMLGGCVTLEEGEYSCAREGECPSGWHCWRDQRCYIDSETLGGLGETCDTQADCEADWTCIPSLDPTAVTMPGDTTTYGDYCSHACTADGECADLGPDSECVAGYCRISCMMPMACPDGTACRRVMTAPPMAGEMPETPPANPICVDVRNMQLTETSACSGQPDCVIPGWCVWSQTTSMNDGVCALRCDSQMNCPMGTQCVSVLEDAKMCLRTCTSPGPACQRGLSCQTFGGASYCVPAAWDGLSAPLPGSLSDTMMGMM